MINQIVFGIPCPPKKKFEYFQEYLPSLRNWYQKPVVELDLFKGQDYRLYFTNQNPFDLPNNNFENIWMLIQTLTAENVL